MCVGRRQGRVLRMQFVGQRKGRAHAMHACRTAVVDAQPVLDEHLLSLGLTASMLLVLSYVT
jgi:hypothetical protein